MAPDTYLASVTIARQLTIDGYGSTLTGTSAGAPIQINEGANATILGLTISDLSQTPLRCDGGTASRSVTLVDITLNATTTALIMNPCAAVTVRRSKLNAQNANVGSIVVTSDSAITLDRTIISGGGGIQTLAATASVQVTNSIILNQTGSSGALDLVDGHINVAFTTFINAPIKCGSAAGTCIDSPCISDSILMTNTGDAVAGLGCVISNSMLKPQAGAYTGTSNIVNVDPMFVDAANGNYALASGSPAIDAAPAGATIPASDFVGTARPQGPRADLGAYEYKP